MEVGLGPGDFVIDGDPAPTAEKRHSHHEIFGLCLLWPNGWMDQDVTWYGGKLRPRRRCIRWGRSSPRERGTAAPPPLFWAHVYCGHSRPSHSYCCALVKLNFSLIAFHWLSSVNIIDTIRGLPFVLLLRYAHIVLSAVRLSRVCL